MLEVAQDGFAYLELDRILLRATTLRSSNSKRFLPPIKII
jgi:hypothetical protein